MYLGGANLGPGLLGLHPSNGESPRSGKRFPVLYHKCTSTIGVFFRTLAVHKGRRSQNTTSLSEPSLELDPYAYSSGEGSGYRKRRL